MNETYNKFLFGDSSMELVLPSSNGGFGGELAFGAAQGFSEALVELALQDVVLGHLFVGRGAVNKILDIFVGEILKDGLHGAGDFGIQVAQNLLAVVGGLDARVLVGLVPTTSSGATASLRGGGILARIFLRDTPTCSLPQTTDLALERARGR